MSPVVGVVLAAGEGRRLGLPKALVRVAGETFAALAVAELHAAGVEDVVLVVGAAADEVAEATVGAAMVVVNERWQSGLASSLATGLAAAPPHVAAAVIVLVDQPGCTSEVVALVVDAWRASPLPAAAASWGGVTMPPVVLGRDVWPQVIATAGGDVGARDWLRANPSRVLAVPADEVADLRDLDTAADLRRWKVSWQGGR